MDTDLVSRISQHCYFRGKIMGIINIIILKGSYNLDRHQGFTFQFPESTLSITSAILTKKEASELGGL